jgi:hypothetical protein
VGVGVDVGGGGGVWVWAHAHVNVCPSIYRPVNRRSIPLEPWRVPVLGIAKVEEHVLKRHERGCGVEGFPQQLWSDAPTLSNDLLEMNIENNENHQKSQCLGLGSAWT